MVDVNCVVRSFYFYFKSEHTYHIGITVAINEKSSKKIRVFPLIDENRPQPRLRTNETYDQFVIDGLDQPVANRFELRDRMKGHVGICILRDLVYFDVGKSFLSDSLHNVYHGVIVSFNMTSPDFRIDFIGD